MEFDPTVLPYERLVASAKEVDCTHRVYARTDKQLTVARKLVGAQAMRSDAAVDTKTTQQYHLSHYPEYHLLPLTAMQATRVNSLLASRESPDALLSPTQLAQHKVIAERLARNPKAFAELRPDRTPEGIARYASVLEARLRK